jgi:hypothetical protein
LTEEKQLSEQQNQEIKVPEGAELIDDVFYVWATRYGLYSTMTKEGRLMLTGATKDGVTVMTRWHLKCEQDGTLHLYTRVTNATMGVKL